MPANLAIPKAIWELACAMRNQGESDDAIASAFRELGIEDASAKIIALLNEGGMVAGSNSRATFWGWCSMLIACVAAGGGAFVLREVFNFQRFSMFYVFMIVAGAFGLHVVLSKILDALGLETGRPIRRAMPTTEELAQAVVDWRSTHPASE